MTDRNTAVARISTADLAAGTTFSERQIDLIRNQIARGATDDELMLFVQVASSRGLDPFRRHIYAVQRYDAKLKRYVMTHQVSIDGLRLIAERTGKYAGQLGHYWCGKDGVWTDVWLQDDPPAAAKIAVLRDGFREPLWAVALYKTYVQRTKEGEVTKFWKTMPEIMTGKCAEAAALRRAFPEETGGLYITEEMGQAGGTIVSGEVIDHETGEITETATPDIDDRTRAMRHLHAWANEHAITHEDLHYAAQAIFRSQNLASLNDLTATQLQGLRDKLEEAHAKDPAKLRAWLGSINPETVVANDDRREPDDTGADGGQAELVTADAGDRTPGVEAVAAYYRR